MMMATTLEQAERIVKELSEADRETLLQKLIDEIDPVDSEIEKAWTEESRSRLQAMREGSLDLIDEDEAFSRAMKSLDEKI
jgi:uncharacterized membrane protein